MSSDKYASAEEDDGRSKSSADATAKERLLGRLVRRVKTEPLVPRRARLRTLSVVLLAMVVAGTGTTGAVERMSGLPDGVAFRVGNVSVSEDELAHRVKLLDVLYGVQRPPADQPKKRDAFTRDTAKAVAFSYVIEKAAADRGIVVPDTVAANQVDKLASQGRQGKQGFAAKLKQLGISKQDVVAAVKRQMTNARLYRSATKNVQPPSENELKQAYQARKDRMVIPERRHLRNIVLPDKKTANKVAQRARSGEDFADLARETSIDASTKNAGGDLGQVRADQLAQPYAKAAFSAEPNSVFGPVQTKKGWNVGKVLTVTPSKQLSYERAKDKLRAQLVRERKAPVWKKFLANAIAGADVEYADKYRPAEPAAPPTIGR